MIGTYAAPAASPPHDRVEFAHESERRFAALLDFYGVEWCYEPRTFVLEEDAHGVRSAFTPDFYLPGYDLYVELTTLRQKLVTKKNRKVRQLRERYPDVTIKVLYQRDMHALLSGRGPSDTRKAR